MNEINRILADPCTSYWLRDAIKSAMQRDPLDAAHDAETLAALLDKRCDEILAQSKS